MKNCRCTEAPLWGCEGEGERESEGEGEGESESEGEGESESEGEFHPVVFVVSVLSLLGFFVLIPSVY